MYMSVSFLGEFHTLFHVKDNWNVQVSLDGWCQNFSDLVFVEIKKVHL